MTPDIFYEFFVQPDYQSYLEMPGDLRRAFHSCVSAAHFADHIFTYYDGRKLRCPTNKNREKTKIFEKTLNDYINELKIKSPEYCHIRSISNAYKHLYLHNPDINIVGSPGALHACFSVDDRDIRADGMSDYIEVRSHHGKTYRLQPLLAVAINFLRDELDRKEREQAPGP